MMHHIYLSDFHGCAYALDEGVLISTPMFEDLTYDTSFDNWVEVDVTDFKQGSDSKVHVEWVQNHLFELEFGVFASTN